MKQILSPSLVKSSLSSHSWIGILVGALMYLVCLSGTLAVFYQEFERWEQPAAEESMAIDPLLVERAYNEVWQQSLQEEAPVHAEGEEEHRHMFVLLPTENIPRTVISSDSGGWFMNQDGTLGEKVNHEWTHLLINLHLYLHLPISFGMIVVSILGAMLCGLIISGFLAHPGIFKDAFSLRLKGARRLEQTDIHNRLSVWGAPFHLMIAVTGAYFGLAMLISLVTATAFYDGDSTALMADVYGAEPKLNQPLDQPLAIAKALQQMPEIAPGTTPFYITVEDAGEPEQYMLIGAEHPGRMIYAEQYRFDSAGNYLNKAGFSDGEAGKQIIFSVYRIHFGHFGGFAVKVLYLIFGLALTVVSVSGINIWLAKRKQRDALNNIWVGLVWGTPVALALSAITQIIFQIPSVAVMWVAVALAIGAAQYLNDDARAKAGLQVAGALMIGLLITCYLIKFGAFAFTPIAMGVNISLVLVALVLLFMASRQKRNSPLAELVID